MNSYLHLRCGSYQLLLDAGQVLAIEDCGSGATQRDELRLWRSRQLPVVNLCMLLNINADQVRQQLVVGRSEQDPEACIIDIDVVTSLVELQSQDFLPMAPIHQLLERLVDAVHIPNPALSRTSWLRLRTPISRQSIGAIDAEVHA